MNVAKLQRKGLDEAIIQKKIFPLMLYQSK